MAGVHLQRTQCLCTALHVHVLYLAGAVNSSSSRMHFDLVQADQTQWLTLRFTTPGSLDPCNGPHVPIGGACHPDLPDSKLLARSAAPHLLLPPGLSSSLTSLRGRRSFVILHRVYQLAVRILPQSLFFWARRQQRSICFDRHRPAHTHTHTTTHTQIHTHRTSAHTHSLGLIRPHHDLTLLILHQSNPTHVTWHPAQPAYTRPICNTAPHIVPIVPYRPPGLATRRNIVKHAAP
jgi:hypothetical protein